MKKLFFVALAASLSGMFTTYAQSPGGSGFVVRGGPPPDKKPVEGQPLETRQPNGKGQKPTFAEQTRAGAVMTKTPVKTTVVTDKLAHPWGMAFLPDGRLLITEKKGAIRIVNPNGTIGNELGGVPKVLYMADAGLLDVAVDPDFGTNRTFYICYVEQRTNGSGVTVASAVLSADEKQAENLKVMYRVEPTLGIPAHYGSRLLFDKTGNLFVSTGERFLDNIRIQAQHLSSPSGKILRISKDGAPAVGNPAFADSAAAKKEVWAFGVRNPQGLAFHPETGELWESEHGQQGGDEINIIRPGKNYGWPVIAYGTEYTGKPINGGKTAQTGMEQPIYFWDPAIAPSGITFYSGKRIPEWKNNLFVAALAGQHLVRLVINDNRVVGEERLLLDQKQRIRDVAESPDGTLWVLTDADNGRLIKLSTTP